MDIDGFDGGLVGTSGFVWVVLDSSNVTSAAVHLEPFAIHLQASKSALDRLLLDIVRYAKNLIEVASSA